MQKLKEQAKTAESQRQPLENYLFYKMENDFEEKEKYILKI